jgi:tetratricopeptide (TPR) repeat protein
MTPFPAQVANWLSTGEDFLTRGHYDLALPAFEQALNLAQQSCHPQAEVLALQQLGRAHLGQGQPFRSVASIQRAIAIALEQHNLNDLYESHRQLAQTYKSMGSFELALEHLEAAEGLRDSLGLPVPTSQPTHSGLEPLPELWPPTDLAELAVGHSAVGHSAVGHSKDAVRRLFRSIVERANVGVAIFSGSPALWQPASNAVGWL